MSDPFALPPGPERREAMRNMEGLTPNVSPADFTDEELADLADLAADLVDAAENDPHPLSDLTD